MSADPRNRRSFSLRTLLSVVTVLAVLFAMALDLCAVSGLADAPTRRTDPNDGRSKHERPVSIRPVLSRAGRMSDDVTPKRRWIRFSLAGLIWLVTITAVGLAVARARSGHDAVVAFAFVLLAVVGALILVRGVRS